MAVALPDDFKVYCKYLAYMCGTTSCNYGNPLDEGTYRINFNLQHKDGELCTIYVATDILECNYYIELKFASGRRVKKEAPTMDKAYTRLLKLIKENALEDIGNKLLSHKEFITDVQGNLSNAIAIYESNVTTNITKRTETHKLANKQTEILRETDDESTHQKKTD